MILIVDMCSRSLSRDEFVEPVKNIIENSGYRSEVVHFSEIKDKHLKAEKMILCGTALKDNEFLEHDFSWIKNTDRPVFGICAGAQAIAKAFGGRVVKQKEIGMVEIDCDNGIFGKEKLSVYQLHGNGITLPDGFDKIAWNEKGVQGIKRGRVCGVQFHPEVRNDHILVRWLRT